MTDLVKVEDFELSAELKEIKDAAREVIDASISPNTRRAYEAQFRSFTAFCVKFGLVSIPAKPETVAGYVGYMVKSGKSTSGIVQAIAAIKMAHKRWIDDLKRKAAAGDVDMKMPDDPTASALVKAAVGGARRTLGTAPHKKAAATVDVVRALLDGLDRSTVQGKRDAAILLLGFAGAFRRSELVALDVSDLERTTAKDGKGAYLVHIRHSKTDQEGAGLIKAVFSTKSRAMNPVAALDEYMTAAQITDGPIFRRVRRGDHVESERLTGRSVALIVKAAAARAGVDLDLAGHSLRSGFITSALAAGASERSVMNQSGHRSVTVMRGYQQRANALQDNAAAGLAGLM